MTGWGLVDSENRLKFNLNVYLTMEKAEMIKKVSTAIHEIEPDAEIFLFGSRARGDFNIDSDWDFLVLTPNKKITFDYEMQLREPILNIEIQSGEVISLIVYSKVDWQTNKSISPLFCNVSREGIKI
jgi:predicted nucleotidyltransferase